MAATWLTRALIRSIDLVFAVNALTYLSMVVALLMIHTESTGARDRSRTPWLSIPLFAVAGFELMVQMAAANTFLQTVVSDAPRDGPDRRNRLHGRGGWFARQLPKLRPQVVKEYEAARA